MIDATAPYACSFKPQIAYFAAQGAESQLERICTYIKIHYPQHVLILDAKRGDIGATAKQYAIEAFERYHADAVTVSPYMGADTVQPYLDYADKGIFILCRTSNAGGSDLQALSLQGFPVNAQGTKLYEHVAQLSTQWNEMGAAKGKQIGLVVGATFPAELARVRAIVGDMPLLIPGIGAQGGDVVATVQAGKDANQRGMLINSSRAILYASSGADFATAAALVAQKTRDEINQALLN